MAKLEKVKETVQKIRDSAWYASAKKATKAAVNTVVQVVKTAKHVVFGGIGVAKTAVHVVEAGADTVGVVFRTADYLVTRTGGRTDASDKAYNKMTTQLSNVGTDLYNTAGSIGETSTELFGAGCEATSMLYQFGSMTVQSLDATKELVVAAKNGELRAAPALKV